MKPLKIITLVSLLFASTIIQVASALALKATTAFSGGATLCSTLGSISVVPDTGNQCTSDANCTLGIGSICTTDSNYTSRIANAFNSNPYLLISTFGTACSASTLMTATAYAADGKCHPISKKYFKVDAGAGGKTTKITTYTDNGCTVSDNATAIISVNSVLSNNPVCDAASKTEYAVGINSWPTALDVVGVYASSTCEGTASKLKISTLSGTSCAATSKSCTSNALTDCTTNIGYKSYMDAAFGSVPYLIKEVYTGLGCTSNTRGANTAYAADGNCYTDGTGSFKVVSDAWSHVYIRTYSVANCGSNNYVEIDIKSGALLGNLCLDSAGNSAKYYMGGKWMLTTNAVYDDSTCGITPSMFSYTVSATCATGYCRSTTGYGNAIGYSVSGCVNASEDHFATIDKAFGMTPYVVEEAYSTAGCADLAGIIAYVADARCHRSADAQMGYRVTQDPTSASAAVNIEKFSSVDCTTGKYYPITIGSADLRVTCIGSRKYYIGGLSNKLTAITTYSDMACTNPVQVVFSSLAGTCQTQSTCTPVSNGLFMKKGCADDSFKFLADLFKTTRRLVTDIYEAKGDDKCSIRQGIMAYVGDGKCYLNLDTTTSFKVTLGATNTATATLTTYNNVDCTGNGKPLTIAPETLTAGLCDGASSMKFAVNGSEPTEAPATMAPTAAPEPTSAANTGSGTSGAISYFSAWALGMVTNAAILGVLAVLLN